MAKRYNIKGANSIIDKAIAIVGNYEHYAQEVGVPPHWIHKITEEIGYRIEKVGSVLRNLLLPCNTYKTTTASKSFQPTPCSSVVTDFNLAENQLTSYLHQMCFYKKVKIHMG